MVQFIKTSEDGTMRALSGNRPSVWDSSQHTHTLKNTKHAAWYARNQKQEQDHIETTVAKTRYIAIYGASHCPCRLSFPMQSFWLSFFACPASLLLSVFSPPPAWHWDHWDQDTQIDDDDDQVSTVLFERRRLFRSCSASRASCFRCRSMACMKMKSWKIKVSHTVHGTYRRKFRSQTSDKMDRWKAEVESEKRREKKRREEKRREEKRKEEKRRRRSGKRKSQKTDDAGARKGRKVAKHRVFTKICGSGGPKSRLATVAGAEPI